MINQLPGAKGLYPYRKVEWDLREAIAILAIALGRSQSTQEQFRGTFDLKKFENLVEYVSQGLKVYTVTSGWYFDGPPSAVKDATDLLSDAVASRDLRRRPNYKYATAELMRWAVSLDIDLTSLLPEFAFPAIEDVVAYLKAQEDARKSEQESLRHQRIEARQFGSAITINGPVQAVNQGNESITQAFNNGHVYPNLDEVLEALRAIAHDEMIPDAERRALAVTVEQVEKHAEKPVVQGNWLQTAKDTLETVGAIPLAVEAAKMIAAYLGTRI